VLDAVPIAGPDTTGIAVTPDTTPTLGVEDIVVEVVDLASLVTAGQAISAAPAAMAEAAAATTATIITNHLN
jgi:hypothetical protein